MLGEFKSFIRRYAVDLKQVTATLDMLVGAGGICERVVDVYRSVEKACIS